MGVNYTQVYCQCKLRQVDYNQRLKLIYQWVKDGYINQSTYVNLINFSVDLDLVVDDTESVED